MIAQPVWQRWSVQKFFGDYNWKGQSSMPEEGRVERSLDPLSWQCLTVEEFWKLNNWQGRPLDVTDPEEERMTFSLALTVSQFLQHFAWEGQAQIAVLPQLDAKAQPSPSSDNDHTVSDFLNLF